MNQQTRLIAIPNGAEFALSCAFLDGLVAQDFSLVRDALAPLVHMRSLLPAGLQESSGADVVASRFERWFGDTEQFDPIEVTLGEVGGRAQLRWRFRLQARRLGPGSFIVEQAAYADIDDRVQIERLDLVCSGYLREASDG